MRPLIKDFPIGYLTCMECGDTALWLISDTEYTPMNDKTINMQLKYRLVNFKNTDYDPGKLDAYLCDSCGCRIYESNYTEKYLNFLSKDVDATIQ